MTVVVIIGLAIWPLYKCSRLFLRRCQVSLAAKHKNGAMYKRFEIAIVGIATLFAGGCETLDVQNAISQFSQGLNSISSAVNHQVGSGGGKSMASPQQASDSKQDGDSTAFHRHNVRKDYSVSEPLPSHSSSGPSASSTSESGSSMAYGEVVETDIEHQTAITMGTAKTQEEARKIALKTAVEEVVGFYMDAAVSMVNDDIQQKVNTVSNGSVTNCTVLSQGPIDGGLYRMKIKAVVKQEDVQAAFKNVEGFSAEKKATSLRDRQAEILSRQIKNADQSKMLADFLEGMDPVHQWVKISDVSYEVAELVPIRDSSNPAKLRLGDKDYSILAVTYTIACSQADYLTNFEGHFAKILKNVASGNKKPKAEMPGCVPAQTVAVIRKAAKAPVTARVDGHEGEAEILTSISLPRRLGIADIPHAGELWTTDFEVDEDGDGDFRKPYDLKFRSEISLVSKCNEDFSVFEVTSFPVSEKVYGSYREWYRKIIGDTYVFNIFLQDDNGKDVMAMSDKIPGPWLFRDDCAYVGDGGRVLKNFVFGPMFEVTGQLRGQSHRENCNYVFSPGMTRTVYFKVPNDKLGSIFKAVVEIP